MKRPHYDEKTARGIKRTYWDIHETTAVRSKIAKQVSGLISKRNKPYSREDQKKIAAERYGEFCERHPQSEEG